MSYNVAVVGATGNVGRELLNILAERNFPITNIFAVASSRSAGREVSFGDTGKTLKVQDLATFDFSQVDIGLFSPGGSVSAEYAPKAAAAGCVVIDNTSHFRMQEDVPLVVPEVNKAHLENFRNTNIIANPNCSTIQMLVALKPLHDIAPIKRISVATYQSVSGAGKSAMDELYDQTKRIYVHEMEEPAQFTKQISFNVIPHIDVFMDDGSTKEEWKMVNETKKMMGSDIEVIASCVRVPVFVGHGEAIHVEFHDPITEEQARAALEQAEGVVVHDRRENGGYITPIECVGDDAVYISRLRQDESVENGLAFWCVSDNVRKGAALNAVQIAETLMMECGLEPKASAKLQA